MNKKLLIAGIILCTLVGGVACSKKTAPSQASSQETQKQEENLDAVLSLEYNKDVTEGFQEEIVIPVKLNTLPSGVYPCASMSIEFDKEKLEFTGIENGTIENYSKQVPTWEVDVVASNNEGVVNTIYLDPSGAKNSYHKSGFVAGEKDVVLNLKFKLKENAKAKDIININVLDAMFATVNGDTDNSNLSTRKTTMKAENLTIEVK